MMASAGEDAAATVRKVKNFSYKFNIEIYELPITTNELPSKTTNDYKRYQGEQEILTNTGPFK